MEGHGRHVRVGGAERLGSVAVVRSLRVQWSPTLGYGLQPQRTHDGQAPNELLRTSGVTRVGVFADYHRALVKKMAAATEAAKKALAKDQAQRARYYDRQVRRHSEFQVGDKVWVLRPPKGKGIAKLAHKWVGPARIDADAGFDNWEVLRDDTDERMIAHCSFLVKCSCPSSSLGAIAERVLRDLVEEDTAAESVSANEEAPDAPASVNAGSARASGTAAAGRTEEPAALGTAMVAAGPDSRTVPMTGRGPRAATPEIATTAESVVAGVSRQEAPRPPPAKPQRRRAKQARPRSGQDPDEAQKRRRREEADAARERRAARREAGRHEQEAAATKSVAADGDDGVRDAPSADRGGEAGPLDEHARKQAGRRDGDRREAVTNDGRGTGADSVGTQHGSSGASVGAGAQVEMLRGRGRPRQPAPMPELLQVATAGHIEKRARRRTRNRAGRYVIEHEVEYTTRPGIPTGRRWLSAAEFETLLDAGKIADDLTSGNDV
ncbi:hypothetical protein PF010_g8974 [Phytophthora fragariae]|uniref:Uncharacterized protein n=1 Tax=Phytophthora fragariae TaxID=53985 RepID=A0A6A3QFP5_9STRA|nr:hypothetical protein PF003_g24906 [Phytophthora fragariae]KAE8940187.1 hypothetical protein PF009_g9996 [Phytophthora fragariae]KAE9075572.1 hypothetical protein PF007_g24950 [Phytophthora fragariae]KAE9116385.1 hypothetical protein PF010_g8974 [Phytophthora fragariae]KAE9146461.1 hypothetical protein PF006_g8767 [Phytophthora fragariae]